MKVAVITDSNSGIVQSQARELGIWVVPMPFMINGELFEEDISLSQPEFYKQMEEGADITTSQPSPGDLIAMWKEILTEYDEIVHIPMSSGLSSSCQTAMVLAEDFDGRVQVVNNQRIAVTQRQSALDAKEMADHGFTAIQIKARLEQMKAESGIYVTVTTLKYLKKGGRVTPAAAALGTLLQIKPVLQIHGEKLDAFSKARTMKQAKSTMLAAVAHELERFGDPTAENTWLAVAHSNCEEVALEFAGEVRQLYPGTDVIRIDPLSLSIACHTGPGALGFTCAKKLNLKEMLDE